MSAHDRDEGVSSSAIGSFDYEAIRLAFVRKVFLLVGALLAFATATVTITSTVGSIRQSMMIRGENSNVVLAAFLISSSAYLVAALLVLRHRTLPRRYPTNLVLLLIVTVSSTILLSIISASFQTELVFIALGITTLSCLGICIFSLDSSCDVGSLPAMISFLLLLIASTYGLVLMPFSTTTIKIVGGVVALVFQLYLFLEANHMTVLSSEDPLSPEGYLAGALKLYSKITFISWFIFVAVLDGVARAIMVLDN